VEVNSTTDLPFTVTNSGGGTLAGSVTTSSPFSLVSGDSFSLTAGQSQEVTVRFSPTTTGIFSGLATVNSNGGIFVVLLTGRGIIVEELLPDLKIGQLSVTPESALLGDELTVSVTVVNVGNADADPFRLGVYLSDDDLITAELDEEMGSCEFEGLATGLESAEGNVCPLTFPFTLPENFTPRTKSVYIGAYADDEVPDAVKESNEGNNSDYVEVTIEPGDCEGVFQATLKECLETGTVLECVGQALAALEECQSGS
jgi:hypothetical protein